MEMTRSEFLVTSMTAALGTVAAPALAMVETVQGTKRGNAPLSGLSARSFSSNMNTAFWIQRHDSSPIRAELIDVQDDSERLAAQSGIPGMECFSVVFHGPEHSALEQDIYELTHDRMGTFSLLLVPIVWEGGGMYYEAVFSRMPLGI